MVQQLMDHWDVLLPGRVLHLRYCDLVRDQVGCGVLEGLECWRGAVGVCV